MARKPCIAICALALAGCGGTRITHKPPARQSEPIAIAFDESASFGLPVVSDVRCHFVDANGDVVSVVAMERNTRTERGWQWSCPFPADDQSEEYYFTFVNSNGDLKRTPAVETFEMVPAPPRLTP